MEYLLGIDFGGGASKGTLINTAGEIVGENEVEYPTYYPKLGWCEQKCEDWIGALIRNVRGLLEKTGIDPGDILAMALDSATHTWVMCDETYTPIRPAIHWTDSRSVRQAAYLNVAFGDRIYELSFHRPDTIWTLPQLLWVREEEKENFRKLRHIFFEKDYIRYWLTGAYGTDCIEAQGSMLFDCRRGCWSKELLAIAGIGEELLPPVAKPEDTAGRVTARAAGETGLREGMPVIYGTTDTVLEVFASGAVRPGDMTVKLATAGRICVVTEEPYPSRHLVNYSHVVPGLWYPGTATKSAAASYRWYRDTFQGSYEELNKGAEKVPIGCEGLLFHPYLNGELTPYADPGLCGSFTGVRATHTKAHFTRSVLEGVSLSLLHSLRTLEETGIRRGSRAVILGGGAKGALWRQITADCLGLELVKTKSSDSSLGAAMLAGVAAGVFSSCEEAAEICVKEDGVTVPVKENKEKYHRIFREYVAVHDALAPVYRNRQERPDT